MKRPALPAAFPYKIFHKNIRAEYFMTSNTTTNQVTSSESSPVIELIGVSKRFGGTVALNDVNWSVGEGEVHCLIGENGSGKSTLIKLVSGVHAPEPSGQIRIREKQFDRLTPHQSKELGVQVIYQDLSLFPNLTVAENISIDQLLGNPVAVVSKKKMEEKAAETLRGLKHHIPLDVNVGTLSVAERQIVAIGRGLAANAKVLFMDEPTASLTRNEVNVLFDLVRHLKSIGVTVVFVSHRLDEITEIAERVSVLRDGVMLGTYPAGEMDDHKLSELMTGDSIGHKVQCKDTSAAPVLLEVRELNRSNEFEDINFELRKGEVLGLTGLLGAGRTELALTLFGMTQPDSGTLILENDEIKIKSNEDAIKAGIAYVSEDRLSLGLNLRNSISDNIAISVLGRLANALNLIPSDARRNLAETWVEQLGIKTPNVGALAQTLSGGNQQRVVLAKWLATNPKVLILDSPTVGVDIKNKEGIYNIVRSLAEKGVSILLISDEIPEVYYNCDRVLHMKQGKIKDAFIPGKDTIEKLESAVYA